VSSLGMTAGVFVAGPASASSSTTTTTTTTTALASPSSSGPAAHYFVINGTVNAASDHERLGSSAFPNYATGAVDNYYSMAHSHVDNSPFAEGTASPADTGPIGQTAAAGNTQQPQYADARWPGNSGKATYGTQGGPYAVAEASEYKATAESSEATSGLSGPSAPMAAPKGFDGRLRLALAKWKAKWQGRLAPKTPATMVTTPTATVPTPTPTATVTIPTATMTTPTATVGGLPTPPPVTVPSPPLPSPIAPARATPSRSLQSASGDGASLLESSTLATLDPKTGALVTSGESRLGRVSLGGGQIVLEGIHVSASITNDGTPIHKVAVVVGAATIGGVPVTIDQDGVHVAGQGQNLPYQQASDALNNALKQAGIQLFLVAPEITRGSDAGNTCTNSSGDTSNTTTTTTNSTTTNSSAPSIPTSTNSSGDTSNTCTNSSGDTGSTSCPTSSSGQTGTTTTTTRTTTTNTTTNSSVPAVPTTTTTSSGDTGNTCTNSSGDTGSTPCPTSSSGQTGKTTTTNTSGPTGTPTTTNSSGETGTPAGGSDSSEEKVTATGVHVVFTQPVDQPGVPAQYVQHILGEVSVDSLATPAGPLPNLNLSSLNLTSVNSCGSKGGHAGRTKKSGGASKGGGGSSAGGSTSSSSPSASGFGSTSSGPTSSSLTGSASQPVSSLTGNAGQAFPTRLAAALRKPLWLLLAYLLWQALMIGTGWSLWRWHRGGAL
jgi:hypothetical protein